jgi:hypothetical protein
VTSSPTPFPALSLVAMDETKVRFLWPPHFNFELLKNPNSQGDNMRGRPMKKQIAKEDGDGGFALSSYVKFYINKLSKSYELNIKFFDDEYSEHQIKFVEAETKEQCIRITKRRIQALTHLTKEIYEEQKLGS